MAVADRSYTVEDLLAMSDDGRKYELQEGLLLSEPLPAPRHGRVAANVASLLLSHVRRLGLGTVYSNDVGFILARRPDTVRGPDVAFVTRRRVETMDESAAVPGPPDLAIEVLSPGNTEPAMHAKIADYLAAGTPLVWVVDPEREVVRVYRTLLSPCVLTGDDELDGEDVVPGFRVKIASLFET